MNKKLVALCLVSIGVTSIPVTMEAQLHPAKQKEGDITIVVGEDNPGKEVINVFVDNSPKAYSAADLPTFAIIGKNKKFYLGLGGYAKTTLSYDFGNPITNGNEFTTSAIPMNNPKGNDGLVQFSAQTSNIFANFVALPGDDNQLGIYVSGNFLANNYNFQLSFAYLNFRGFTVGYNYTLFCDVAASAPSIDYEYAPAFTIIPNTVIDYTHAFNSRWSMGIGLESPIASATTNASTYMVNQRVPDIPAYAQYSWDKGNSWVRLGAIMRNMAYWDKVGEKTRNATAWGVNLSGSATLLPHLTSYYQMAYGKGISSYFQDLYNGNLDMVPSQTPGKLETVKAWGGFLGLQYNFTPNTFASCTYSQLRDYAPEYADGSISFGNQYKYAQYLVANLFWNVAPRVQMGMEYIYGRRVNMDATSHHNNRVQTMVKFNF
ncbi:MAG: hypothetical protein RR319_04495 [Bacteroides sp.]